MKFFASFILVVITLIPSGGFAAPASKAFCACYHDEGLCTVFIGDSFADSQASCNQHCTREYRTCRGGDQCITDSDCPLGTPCESTLDNKGTLWSADANSTPAKLDKAKCELDDKTAKEKKKESAGDEKIKAPIIPQLSVAIPGLSFAAPITQGNTVGVEFIGPYIKAAYSYAMGIGILIVVVMIMIGGVQWILAAGTGNLSAARERINNAVMGFILLLCVYLILYLVNPSLTILRETALEGIPRIEFNLPEMENANPGGEAGVSPPGGAGFNGVPSFKQGGAPWGGEAYGKLPRCEPGGKDPGGKNPGCCSSYGWAGCGATSLAMVLKFYGENVDPRVTGAHSIKIGARTCNNGTNGTMARRVAETWPNFASRQVNLKRVVELWKRGEKIPVMTATPNIAGCYKPGGHWIVLTGIDEKGFIRVNDPASGRCFEGRGNADGYFGEKGLGLTHIDQKNSNQFSGVWVVAPKDKMGIWFK